MKHFILIMIFSLSISEFIEENEILCKKELLESYDLSGFLIPRSTPLYLCPNINSNCCSNYDQFRMYEKWDQNVRQNELIYAITIKSQFIKLQNLLQVALHINLKNLIWDLNIDNDKKAQLWEMYQGVLSSDLLLVIETLIEKQDQIQQQIRDLRKSFMCYLCDFNNHRFFKIKNQEIVISNSSCQYLAINYSANSLLMYSKLYKNLHHLTNVVKNLGDMPDSPMISSLSNKTNNTQQCYNSLVQVKKGNISICKPYCEYFRINARSPVYEGDKFYNNEVISFLKQYVEKYGNILLELNEETRLLEENNQTQQKKLEETEKLQRDQYSLVLNFQKSQLQSNFDPYKYNKSEEFLNNQILSEMFDQQETYANQKQKGFENFLLNKMDNVDVEYNYASSDENKIFKTASQEIIDLENYKTVIKPNGIIFSAHFQNNFDQSVSNLISHLKKHSKYEIDFEKLDPQAVEIVNDVEDEYLKEFHKDNYMIFTDMNEELIQGQLSRATKEFE